MRFSAYNILTPLADSEEYLLMNILTRNADILSKQEAEGVRKGRVSDPASYREKGYILDEAEESRLYKKAYLDFLDTRDEGEIQIFFVPWYGCNFGCAYCYQQEYSEKDISLDPAVIDAFYTYIDAEFPGRKKYLTLFGGEPLLPGNTAKDRIRRFLQEAARRNLGVAVVTNGYHLKEYLPEFQGAVIREIQVTLDGIGEVHDKRRPLMGGGSTFGKVVHGIDAALDAGYPVNLRVVLDKENLRTLPEMTVFAKEKGWTRDPNFKTQLGRNYELHTCQKNSSILYDRVEMYRELYDLIKQHPEVLDFHRPAFSLSRFLFDNGELPEPLFDSCSGCKTEWAFDFSGRIYSCTATVGKEGEALGTFFPEVRKNREAIEEWEERDVTAIPECRTCNLQLACGGGCGAVSKNREGTILAPDCRPIRELLEMGVSLYS